jgi:hypothetical protein
VARQTLPHKVTDFFGYHVTLGEVFVVIHSYLPLPGALRRRFELQEQIRGAVEIIAGRARGLQSNFSRQQEKA